MAPREKDFPPSTLGIAKPANRPNQNVDVWLEDRQALDGADGLWRIHDKIYDVSSFIDKHPGGSEWLNLSKGTDITAAFEAHHLTHGPEQLLQKFYVREAKKKRNSPFTFHEDGFYRTLKRAIGEKLKTVPKQASNTTDFFMDALVAGTFLFSILSCAYWNFYVSTLAGSFVAMTGIAAHNYLHRKDNFRMYYMHFTLLQVREWRVSHVLSHHLHTNTVDDLEISMWEPYVQYLPVAKPTWQRYGSYLYVPLMWMTAMHLSFFRRLLSITRGNYRNAEPAEWIGLLLPLAMWLFSGQSLLATLVMWNYIILAASTHFFLVGLHAAHHHPDIFHDGDEPRARSNYDWGMGQLDAVMDRKDISGSHFLVLTNFGDHALHHLFPTLDHGALEHLYPVFEEVAQKFNVNMRFATQLESFIGSYKQLARVKPNENPPDLAKYKRN